MRLLRITHPAGARTSQHRQPQLLALALVLGPPIARSGAFLKLLHVLPMRHMPRKGRIEHVPEPEVGLRKCADAR